jgi:hypothetical protein
MYRLALALLILAIAPAAAEAAPFGELPAAVVKHPARCLRATGAPGEVVRWAPDGADFAQATASGFSAPVHVPLGSEFGECPVAAAQPSGAGVVAQLLDEGIGVAVRDPGGSFGPTQTFATDVSALDNPAVAVNARGDAAVAWTEKDFDRGDFLARLVVMRRPAGGTFSKLELRPLKPYELAAPHAVIAMQDDGTIIALWNTDGANGSRDEQLFAAVAPPGAPFGPPQRLSTKLEFHGFQLSAAPDGHALAIVDEGEHTRVLERPAGGGFAPVAEIGYTEDLFEGPVVALRPDGAAIVAWQDPETLQVFALRRTGPGPFGRPEKVGAQPTDPFGPDLANFDDDAPAEDGGRALRAAFAADGRPVLTWAGSQQLGGLDWTAATVATFPGEVQKLSGPLRDADSVTPVILADGRPAIAWSDVSDRDYRLHLAIEGTPAAPAPPAPAVHLGHVVQIRHGLALPFRCSAACDVRATVPDGISGRQSLAAAGSGRLKILPDYDPIMLQRADSVPVQVLSGAPGATTVTRTPVTAKLRVPRLPRFLGLKAVARGKKVVVSWHTDGPLRNSSVIAITSQSRKPADAFFGATVKGEGRRRFHISTERFSRDRYVQLYLFYAPDATERRIAVVRIAETS